MYFQIFALHFLIYFINNFIKIPLGNFPLGKPILGWYKN